MKWLSILSLLCATACGGSTEPKSSAVGVYALVSVGGAPLPASMGPDPLVQGFVVSGSLELKSGGTYVMMGRDSSYCATCGGTPGNPPGEFFIAVEASGGGWSLSGPALTLTDTSQLGGAPVVYIVSGGTITSPAPGNWLYQKR